MSDETKFTKGDLVINDNPKEYSITGETGFGICDTVLHDEIDKYNASLIKTSPKLYEALARVVRVQENNYGNADLTHNVLFHVAQEIEALLAEARGE